MPAQITYESLKEIGKKHVSICVLDRLLNEVALQVQKFLTVDF